MTKLQGETELSSFRITLLLSGVPLAGKMRGTKSTDLLVSGNVHFCGISQPDPHCYKLGNFFATFSCWKFLSTQVIMKMETLQSFSQGYIHVLTFVPGTEERNMQGCPLSLSPLLNREIRQVNIRAQWELRMHTQDVGLDSPVASQGCPNMMRQVLSQGWLFQ